MRSARCYRRHTVNYLSGLTDVLALETDENVETGSTVFAVR
jgi:hypothetical protein